MQAMEHPAQKQATMLTVAVIVAWVASCPPCAHTLKLWVRPRGYYQYLLTKECFGEEVALQQEREAMQQNEYCARQVMGKDPGQSKAPINLNTVDFESGQGGINTSRARRTLVKLPRNPTLEVMMCNLRQSKLLTDDNQVNFTATEDRLQAMKIDPQLKLNLLESAILCRPSSPTSQREDSSDRAALVSAMLAVAHYQGCIGSKSLSICKEFVRSRVASKLHL